MELAQGQARQAIDVYESGQRATAAATATYNSHVAAYNQAAQAYDSALAAARSPGPRPEQPGAFSDPGAALRQRAQQILTAARAERDRSAAQAASKVRAATELAPAEPSFGQQLLDDLSDAVQVGQLADSSFASGILTGVADIGKTARALNPLDPWNITHLAEYTDGLSATAAGLVHDVMHPADAATGPGRDRVGQRPGAGRGQAGTQPGPGRADRRSRRRGRRRAATGRHDARR